MSRIEDAFAAHAALSVSGVTMYDIDDELSLAEAQRTMPCIAPVFESTSSPVRPTASLDVGDNTFTARFKCLIQRAGDERGWHVVTPKAAQVIDAYIDALFSNPTLCTDPDDYTTATLAADATVTISAVVFEELDPPMVGLTIEHEWLFIIDNRS